MRRLAGWNVLLTLSSIALGACTPHRVSDSGCTDALEPNDSASAAATVSATITGLRICQADEDWLRVLSASTVRIDFTHSAGDLDLMAFNAAGDLVGQSAGTANTEQVSVPAGGSVKVFGYNGAQGEYRVLIQ